MHGDDLRVILAGALRVPDRDDGPRRIGDHGSDPGVVSRLPSRALGLIDRSAHRLDVLRVELLQTLLELAAADGAITHHETNLLRLVTRALGLSQLDYNHAQAKHRDRIAALR